VIFLLLSIQVLDVIPFKIDGMARQEAAAARTTITTTTEGMAITE
jgi:hypothetical protein